MQPPIPNILNLEPPRNSNHCAWYSTDVTRSTSCWVFTVTLTAVTGRAQIPSANVHLWLVTSYLCCCAPQPYFRLRLINIGLTGKQASSSSSSLPLTLRLRRRHPLLSSLSLPIFGDIFALSRVWLVILPLLFVFFISLVSTPHSFNQCFEHCSLCM
jgi:hypothetical protein